MDDYGFLITVQVPNQAPKQFFASEVQGIIDVINYLKKDLTPPFACVVSPCFLSDKTE